MGRWLVTCIFWFFWVSIVCVRIRKDVRWGCVLKGLFPLAYSILSLTFNRRLLGTLEKKFILLPTTMRKMSFFNAYKL